MSEAVALGETHDQLGPPERLHPLYLLTGLGQSLKSAWGLFAGGAVLTMLASSMMPTAFEEGGRVVALLTALGFTVAGILTLLD